MVILSSGTDIKMKFKGDSRVDEIGDIDDRCLFMILFKNH